MSKGKYRFGLDLQLFSEDMGDSGGEGTGVEDVSAAGTHDDVTEVSGAGEQAAADPKAFAARLAAEKAKIEREYNERYKDYDTYKQATEYLQRTSGIDDILTLKEEIELANLQERAEKENVPPEVLKRIDELEVKAAKAEEYEAKSAQEKAAVEFEASLKTFVEGKEIDGKPVDHNELWKYMHDNEIGKPEIALKAMKADILEAKLATAKEDSIKDYLNSKRGVKTEGASGAAAQTTPPTGGGFKGAEARAIARVRASRTAE